LSRRRGNDTRAGESATLGDRRPFIHHTIHWPEPGQPARTPTAGRHSLPYASPIIYFDPSGDSPLILVGVLGGVYFCGCYLKERGWDSELKSRALTDAEKACLKKVEKFMPAKARCNNVPIEISELITAPVTRCSEVCNITSGFGSNKIYFGPQDVRCDTCFAFLNTVVTLIHECQHTRQPCGWRSLQGDEAEQQAYKISIKLLKGMKVQCADLVKQGICKSLTECSKTIDQVVAQEEQTMNDIGM
jgi:hypothetical protein